MTLVIGAAALTAVGVQPAAAKTSPPSEWGATFCSSLGKWSDTITDGATEIQSSGSTSESNPAEGKAIIVRFLDGFAVTTRAFHTRIKKAGDPEIDNGARIQKSILKGITGTESRIGDLQDRAAQLPDSDSVAFQAAVNELVSAFDAVTTSFDNAMTKVEKLDQNDELSNVLLELKICRKTLR